MPSLCYSITLPTFRPIVNRLMINNGNRNEWSAIWAEIIRVICNHKYDFRPKLHDTRFSYSY